MGKLTKSWSHHGSRLPRDPKYLCLPAQARLYLPVSEREELRGWAQCCWLVLSAVFHVEHHSNEILYIVRVTVFLDV